MEKVALITGADSGIGKAAALELSKGGYKIAVIGRTKNELEETINEIRSQNGEAISITANVQDENEMQNAIREIANQWNRIDFILANAGINGVWAPVEELKAEEWDEIIDINLRGSFLTIKYCVPYLKKNGGSVALISSVNGTRVFSNSGSTAYAVSKAGQVALAKMLAVELAKHKVRVNVVCPGGIETNIKDSQTSRNLEKVKEPIKYPEGNIPLTDGKKGSAEQVAQLVAFLAGQESSHITGTEVWIDGAESLIQG